MFICMHCGHHFENIDARNYDHGTGTWEEYCPNCGSEDFEEAERCELCDEWHISDKVINGVCEKCIEQGSNDIVNLMRFAIQEDAFEPDELDELIGNGFKKEAKRFALDNKYEFAELLKEE